MIKIYLSDNEIKVSGHARYADYGKDIVCAAVSTCLITTVNGLESIDENYIGVEQKPDEVVVTINKTDEVSSKLINNMIDIFTELESQYPKNIKIYK